MLLHPVHVLLKGFASSFEIISTHCTMTIVIVFFSLTFAFRTLIYVYAFKIHLCNCHRRVDRIFNVPKLGVAGIDIYNRHDGCYFPSIRAPTIKIRSGEFHWSRIFVGSSWSVEWKSGICIVEVANTYVVYSFWIMPLSNVSIVW